MRGITSRDETIREITHRETRRKQNESRNRFLSLPFHPWIPDVNGQVTITSFENTWHFIHKDHDFPMRIRFWTFIYRRNLSRYTTDFLEFCFLPILLWRIFENFPTYVHFSMTGSPSSLSLSLSLLPREKNVEIFRNTTLFFPRGLYPANGSIGRQSNCVAIRRVAIGERRRKERAVYIAKGGKRMERKGRMESGEEG